MQALVRGQEEHRAHLGGVVDTETRTAGVREDGTSAVHRRGGLGGDVRTATSDHEADLRTDASQPAQCVPSDDPGPADDQDVGARMVGHGGHEMAPRALAAVAIPEGCSGSPRP